MSKTKQKKRTPNAKSSKITIEKPPIVTKRQRDAFHKIMIEDGRNKYKNLKEVGYSDAIAQHPKKVTESKGFKYLAKKYAPKVDEAIDDAFNRMKETVNKASYRDTVDATNKLAKFKQIVEEKETNNTGSFPHSLFLTQINVKNEAPEGS